MSARMVGEELKLNVRVPWYSVAINKIHGDTATTTAPAEKSMKPTRANEEKRLMQAKNELFDTMP